MLDNNIIDIFKSVLTTDSLQAVADSLRHVSDSLQKVMESMQKMPTFDNVDNAKTFGVLIGEWIDKHGLSALCYGGGTIALTASAWIYTKGQKSVLSENKNINGSLTMLSQKMDNTKDFLNNQISAVKNDVVSMM